MRSNMRHIPPDAIYFGKSMHIICGGEMYFVEEINQPHGKWVCKVCEKSRSLQTLTFDSPWYFRTTDGLF